MVTFGRGAPFGRGWRLARFCFCFALGSALGLRLLRGRRSPRGGSQSLRALASRVMSKTSQSQTRSPVPCTDVKSQHAPKVSQHGYAPRRFGPSRISGQGALRPPRRPGADRQGRPRRQGRRRGGRGDRLPVRGQGAGADRRPRQGRRHQGRQGPRRGRGRSRGDPGHGHHRPPRRGPVHRPPGLGRGRLGDRVRVLLLVHPRPLGQEGHGDALDHGRHERRGDRREGPRRPRPASTSTRRRDSTPRPPRSSPPRRACPTSSRTRPPS